MKPLEITSSQNPLVTTIRRLKERRQRELSGLFLIEGFRELTRALDGNQPIGQLLTCPERFLGDNEQQLIDRCTVSGAKIYQCPSALFDKLSYRDRPDGLLAIAPQRHISLEQLASLDMGRHTPFFIVAEAIEKPGNLGTILRSADAAGAHGLILCDRCTDLHNPNVVRASVGTLFTVPTAEATSLYALQWLRSHGIAIVAATPSATALYTDVCFKQGIAIAVGTEQLGLSDEWMQAADIKVRIPMHGHADSLNVAMATTLLLYEVVRQRKCS